MNNRIELWQGRDLALTFSLKDANGTAVDLNGAEIVFRAADGLNTAPLFALSSNVVGEVDVTGPAGEVVVNVPDTATESLSIPASQNGPFGAGHGPAQLALDWELLANWPDGRREQLAQDVLFVNATVQPGA